MNNRNTNTNNKNKSVPCPKSGIKIHETPTNINNINATNRQPNKFYNTSLNSLDLDLNNYSLDDLYNLFNIEPGPLEEQSLKNAKQIVHKMHPDKSNLDPKYFLFFLNAYKRVLGIYEFQNKSLKKKFVDEDYYEDSNRNVLDHVFQTNKDLKDPKNFNSWFNAKFEKHNTEESGKGYGEWLKSDEGIYNCDQNITKSNMNEAFENQKKQIQTLTVYSGINDTFASFSGSLLGDDGQNNFSGALGNMGYTDLRQAHLETVIPVTQEDFEKMPKYKSFNDYKTNRDRVDITPISKQEGERLLMQQNQHLEQQSAALAYKYAVQNERAKKGNQSFFSDIKQLTGF
jgi:curved DNA-binding protein CbpA